MKKRIYLIGNSGRYSVGSRALDLPDHQLIPESRPRIRGVKGICKRDRR